MNKSIRVLFLLIAMALALPGSLHAKATKATLTTIKEKLIQYQEIIAGTAAAGVVLLITLLGWKYYSHKKSLKLNDGKEDPINGQGNGNPPKPNKPEDDPGKKTKKEKKEKKEKKHKTPRTGSEPAAQSQPGDVPTHLHNPIPTQSSTNGGQSPAASTSSVTLRQEPLALTDNTAPSASKGTGLKIQQSSTPGSKHRPNITDFFAQSPVVDDKHHSAPVDHRGNTFYGPVPGGTVRYEPAPASIKSQGLIPSYQPSSHASAPIMAPASGPHVSNFQSIGRKTTVSTLKDLMEFAQTDEEKQLFESLIKNQTSQSSEQTNVGSSPSSSISQETVEPAIDASAAKLEYPTVELTSSSNDKNNKQQEDKNALDGLVDRALNVIDPEPSQSPDKKPKAIEKSAPKSDISIAQRKVDKFMEILEASLEKSDLTSLEDAKHEPDIAKAFRVKKEPLDKKLTTIQDLMKQIIILDNDIKALPIPKKRSKEGQEEAYKKEQDMKKDLETLRARKRKEKKLLRNDILAVLAMDTDLDFSGLS